MQCEVLRPDRTPSLVCTLQFIRKSDIRLNEILLWVFTGGVLGVGLVVEREIRAVVLIDSLHFLVSVRLFSPVEESGGYRQAGHDHKDHHRYEACEEGGI